MALTPCEECRQPISPRAKICPHCGFKKADPWWIALSEIIVATVVGIILVFLLILVLVAVFRFLAAH